MSLPSLSSLRGRPKRLYFSIAVTVVFLLSTFLVTCGTAFTSKPTPSGSTPIVPTAISKPTPSGSTPIVPTAISKSTPSGSTPIVPTAISKPTPSGSTPIVPTAIISTPTPLVDDYNNNFATSLNGGFALHVFGTLSTDKAWMYLGNNGNTPINWRIESIDEKWLSADTRYGVANPGSNHFMLEGSNSETALSPGSYKAHIIFKPVNESDPVPALSLIVHELPIISPLSAAEGEVVQVTVPNDTTIGDGISMIKYITFGSAQVVPTKNTSGGLTVTVPHAEKLGDVPITITVEMHDSLLTQDGTIPGSTMSFQLPNKFTYTSSGTAPPQPTSTEVSTQPTGTVHVGLDLVTAWNFERDICITESEGKRRRFCSFYLFPLCPILHVSRS